MKTMRIIKIIFGLLAIFAGVLLIFPPISSKKLIGILSIFFGVSSVISGIKDYEGCEVTALYNFIFHKKAKLWCPLYSPLEKAARKPTARTEQK